MGFLGLVTGFTVELLTTQEHRLSSMPPFFLHPNNLVFRPSSPPPDWCVYIPSAGRGFPALAPLALPVIGYCDFTNNNEQCGESSRYLIQRVPHYVPIRQLSQQPRRTLPLVFSNFYLRL